MSQSGFQVLSEVYRFLGQFDAESLAAASRARGVSDNLRRALKLLADEARSSRRDSEQHRKAASVAGRPALWPILSHDEPIRSTADEKRIKGELSAYFASERCFRSKQALVEFARRHGIEVTADPKCGKLRLARKLAAAFLADPTALERLATDAAAQPDPQTSGWIDLIRRSRK